MMSRSSSLPVVFSAGAAGAAAGAVTFSTGFDRAFLAGSDQPVGIVADLLLNFSADIGVVFQELLGVVAPPGRAAHHHN